MTTSASPVARSGVAKRTPSARATLARDALTSTSSTSQPGMRDTSQAVMQPTAPAPTTDTRSPTSGRASQTPLIAVSRLAASTARAGGVPGGSRCTAVEGTTKCV